MSKQELPIPSESNGVPEFRSELSAIFSGSVPVVASNPTSSLTQVVGDKKVHQSQELLRKGIEIQHSELIYDQKKPIGRGAYGQVFKGSFRKEDVAIKIYDFKGVLSIEEKQNMLLEAQTMDQLRSKYLVGLRGVFFEPNYGLVMEFCAGGTLAQPLKKSDAPIDFAQQLQWGMEISYGLHALHSVRIFHRDLKGDNILLSETRQAKIGDFGLAQIKSASATQSKQIEHSAAGTIPWMAPELFEKKPHTAAADMYSLGMVLWEIISRKTPFQGVMPFVIVGMVMAGKRETLPPKCPRIFQELITACWETDPSKRPTAEKVGEQFEALLKSSKGIAPIISEEIKELDFKKIESSVLVPLPHSSAPMSQWEKTTFMAIEKGDLLAFQKCLQHGVWLMSRLEIEKDHPDPDERAGETFLHTAVRFKQEQIIRELISRGAEVNASGKYGITPLFIAASNGLDMGVKTLLEAKAVVDQPRIKIYDKDKYGKKNITNETPLSTATQNGNEFCIRLLLNAKAEVNRVCVIAYRRYSDMMEIGSAPAVAVAAGFGKESCLRTLIEYKAHLNSTNDYSPLLSAVSCEHESCVRVLLEAKIDINDRRNGYALHYAALSCLETIVALLLESKANPNPLNPKQHFTNQDSPIPLYAAIVGYARNDSEEKRLVVIEQLIRSGADLNTKINFEKYNYRQKEYEVKTYSQIARERKKFKVAQRLEEIPKLNHNLYGAIDKNNYNLTKNILEGKAIVTCTNKEGYSPLFVAAQKGFTQIVKLLLEFNAKVDQAKQPGLTALSSAASRGHLEVVRILLEAKADPTVKTVSGETPLKQALKQKHHAIAALLQPQLPFDQESWREKKYDTSLITSSTGSSIQSSSPATDIKAPSSASMSSSIIATSSSSILVSDYNPATTSEASAQSAPEIKSNITDTPGTLFSTNQPRNRDPELRQPLIPKPPKGDNSSRCCLIL
ncbi:MAG: protein kinase [Proteobacteria bacterium]|nr:protein kinase [Pseudomonadota bacterium]